jgi:hypothetical protein
MALVQKLPMPPLKINIQKSDFIIGQWS